MRRGAFVTTGVLLVLLLVGCGDSGPPIDAAKAADEQAARATAEREQAARAKEQRIADAHTREQLKNDFEQLRGHWDHPGGPGPDGKLLPSCHLEITAHEIARFHMTAGVADSTTECPVRLTSEGGQRFIVQSDGTSLLKLTPLAYHLDGDTLTLRGGATDVLLKDVDLSGAWRRTDWTKKSEAVIADMLKTLGAQVVYDDDKPSRPIVQVAFNFQAPVQNEHLRILTGLKQLQALDLSAATNVSDAGLKHLIMLKQLKQLNLTTVPVSDAAVQKLARELPNCRIVH